MSVPHQSVSHSSSQSKSSIKSQKRQSRNLLPSPHFEEPHLQQSGRHEAIETSAVAEEGSVTDFQPFFTLIENPSTSEHHHPTVHYIFADDDAEIITEAACRALAQDDTQHIPTQTQEDENSKLPPPVDGVREHYVLMDVQPSESGYQVTKVHSLSSEWQVLNASITNAPTIDGTDAESGEGLMLKIEGIGAVTHMESVGSGKRKEKAKESLPQMVERFERGLAEIRKVIDGGQT